MSWAANNCLALHTQLASYLERARMNINILWFVASQKYTVYIKHDILRSVQDIIKESFEKRWL